MNESTTASAPSAAVLIIGNEILSGRTQDINLNAIAKKLAKIGIPLREARIIPDVEQVIIDTLNVLRERYSYVFTTGGIGPTHDDITVDAVAKAFNVSVAEHPDARGRLTKHYGSENLTNARLRMARIPEHAILIDNPVSGAPGFRLENVFVMAGVPNIMQAMMDGVVASLTPGPTIFSKTVSGHVAESIIAEDLGKVALRFPKLDIGSYPWIRANRFGTALVSRGNSEDDVNEATQIILQIVSKHDHEAKILEE